MAKYHYRSTQHKATAITVICLLLFVAYSILLFIDHQSYTVALANYIASGCATNVVYDTRSAVWIATLLGTSLSLIPALLLLYSLHFPIRMKSLAFIPSYIVLGLVTGISPVSADAMKNEMPILLSVVLLLLSSFAILYSQVYHEDRGEHAPLLNYLWGNVLFSCMGIMFCMVLTNSDRQLHLQQPLAQTIYRHDYSFANSIPQGETTTNNTITALRVLSLSKQEKMADQLFSIPTLNGSRGLLPDSTPSALIYHSPQMVYNHLQAIPVNFKGDVTDFLRKAIERRLSALQTPTATRSDSLRAQPLIDYYLCALLLDKDLNSFVRELPRFYTQGLPLPRHYSEALTMYYAEDSLAVRFATDTAMDSTYHAYQQLRMATHGTLLLQHKESVMRYPDTYWNYYHYASVHND